MTSFSPEYQGLPSGWTPPAYIPPFKMPIIPEEFPKILHDGAGSKASFPETGEYKNLRARVAILSSCVGGVAALAISQLINPGISIGNVGLLGIGVLLGNKLGLTFLNSKLALTQNDLNTMLDHALMNPLFQFIYGKVNEQVPLKVVLDSDCSYEQSHSFAHYRYRVEENKLVDHAIAISDKLSPEEAFKAFIYEYANAYQLERMDALCQAAKEGKIGKEDYAICFEFIELGTQILVDEILNYGKRHLNWQIKEGSLIEYIYAESVRRQVSMLDIKWCIENALLPGNPYSHADNYRLQWEQITSCNQAGFDPNRDRLP